MWRLKNVFVSNLFWDWRPEFSQCKECQSFSYLETALTKLQVCPLSEVTVFFGCTSLRAYRLCGNLRTFRVCQFKMTLKHTPRFCQTRSCTDQDVPCSAFCYVSSVIWTAWRLIIATFKTCIFCGGWVGFALSSVENIFTFMILYDFCWVQAWFSDDLVTVGLRYFETRTEIADLPVPW